MTIDRLEYKSSTFRGYANRYERPANKYYLTKPDELRAEAKHLRLVASDLEQAADEAQLKAERHAAMEAALDAEYGPRLNKR